MIKALLMSAAVSFLATAAAAAPPAPSAWVITPAADSCRTEFELTGGSGALVPLTLTSNGDGVDLVFAKAEAPERAFLPIRIDHKPYANLVLRQAGQKTAVMRLSSETLSAMRRGEALQIGWLGDEPLQAALAGSDQGLADLLTCGAQAAARFREERAAQREAQVKADADARAKAVSDEQLAAARAQRQAAEAETRRHTAEAERLAAQTAAERQRAQAEADTAREREAADQAMADDYPDPRGYSPSPRAYYPPQQPAYPDYDQGYYRRW